MHHPIDRIAHTTAVVILVVGHWLQREIALRIDPTTHRPMSERFYHGAISRSLLPKKTRLDFTSLQLVLGNYFINIIPVAENILSYYYGCMIW